MVKDLDVASVLSDSIGEYYTTTDTNDDNPFAIQINYSDNNQPTIIDDAENWEKQKKVAKKHLEDVFDDQIDNKQKAIMTSRGEADQTRANILNDRKYQDKKVNMPDYSSKRQIGPNNSQTTGSGYVTEALNEEIGFNDSDDQILETYTSATDAYIPPKVQQYYTNKGEGLKTTYVDDSTIMQLTIGDLPENHPDRVKYPNELDKQIYIVMHQPNTVSSTSTPTMSELVNPYGTLLETEVFYDERQAGKSPLNIGQTERNKEYMIVDFAGRNLKIDNIRTKRSQPVWKQIQQEIINPAIDPYNDAMYEESYGGGAGGKYN